MWWFSNTLFTFLIILFYSIWIWSICCYYWLCCRSLYFIVLISFFYNFLCLDCFSRNTLLTWIGICDSFFSYFFLLLLLFWRIDPWWICSYICDCFFNFFLLLLLLILRNCCCLRCSDCNWCFSLILFFKIIFFISCILRRISLSIWIWFSFWSIFLFYFLSFRILLC